VLFEIDRSWGCTFAGKINSVDFSPRRREFVGENSSGAAALGRPLIFIEGGGR
jgi:hypothetical protein